MSEDQTNTHICPEMHEGESTTRKGRETTLNTTNNNEKYILIYLFKHEQIMRRTDVYPLN